jgi:hypothetical protein
VQDWQLPDSFATHFPSSARLARFGTSCETVLWRFKALGSKSTFGEYIDQTYRNRAKFIRTW